MKKRIGIAILLLLSVSLCSCGGTTGDTVQNEETEEGTTNGATTSEDPAEDAIAMEQQQGIIVFYDSMLELRESISNRTYGSLNQTMNDMDSVVKAFENLPESSNDDYNNYVKSIITNPMYINFKTYINYESNLDGAMVYDVYEMLIGDCLDIILAQKLPFEYEKQVVNEYTIPESESEAKDYSDIAKEFLDILKKAENDGVDITYEDQGYNHFVTGKEETYAMDPFSEVTIHPYIGYSNSGDTQFVFFICYEGEYYEAMRPFAVKCEAREFTIDTTQMYDLSYGMGLMYLYNSEYSDAMNENYKLLREMLDSDESIYFGIKGYELTPVSDEMINELKDYVELFDTLQLMYESN